LRDLVKRFEEGYGEGIRQARKEDKEEFCRRELCHDLTKQLSQYLYLYLFFLFI